MEPLTYQFADPNAAILNGIKTGAVVSQLDQQRQMQALALQQAAQQQADLRSLAMNPNAGHADYASLMTKYPALAEHLGKAVKVMDDGQQQNLVNFTSRVYAANLAGNNGLATQLLRDRAKADPQQAQHYNTLADLVEQSPSTARATLALGLAGAMGADKFATAFTNLGTEARAEEKQPAEVAKAVADAREATVKADNAQTAAVLGNENIASQIKERSRRLTLDQDKLTSDVKLKLFELGQKQNTLDDGAKKIINDSTVASVAADQSAGQMTSLADRLDQADPASGLAAKGWEAVKSFTGNQDAVTSMRQEYVRLRNSSAMKMLPPGSASDKDVAFVMQGFPADTASAAQMASFMRGLAKIQQREAVFENARAEWVNSVGHSGKPKTDINVDGVTVPAGTTFTDFVRDYVPKAIEKRQAQAVQGRSYMRWADPQATTGTPGASLGAGRAAGVN